MSDNQFQGPSELTVEELKTRLARGDALFLLDVRQPEEFHLSHIQGAKLIPLGELPTRLSELRQGDEIVINCKSGGRSARACEFLRAHGFKKVINLAGGNDKWQASQSPQVGG